MWWTCQSFSSLSRWSGRKHRFGTRVDRVRDVISMEGAGLIAQILPVGLLIVAVERRALGGRRPPRRRGRVGWLVRGLGLIATVTLSVVAVWMCVVAVAQGRAMEMWESTIVFVAGAGLAFVALDTTISLTIRAYAGAFGEQKDD